MLNHGAARTVSTLESIPARRRWVDAVLALGIAALALSALLATGPRFGMVWDEGYSVRREWLLNEWFRSVVYPPTPDGWPLAFEKRQLDFYWKFSREEPHGHPPFYALLGVTGWWLGHGWLRPLQAYRLGPMALAAATAGVLYYHLARRRGRLAGFTSAALLLLMPRVFAHAHYAHYDMPMTCLWLLAQVAFVASLEAPRWAIPFGMALGLSAGSKFTGLFATVPPIAWVVLVEVLPRFGHRARETVPTWPAFAGLRSLAIGVPTALLTLYAIQPPWWLEPLAGPARFVASNLSRARTQPLATLYFGKIYEFSLPWHNTLVLTAVTTPVVVLVLAMTGIIACLARRRVEPWALIWPLSWATLMIVRALPTAPGHDGIRQFLPSVASLAPLSGLGVAWLAERVNGRWGRALALLLVASAIGECLVGMVRTYPYTDSYYNVAIGGLKGAERVGFEVTYYWEAAGPEFLDWVRQQARQGRVDLCFMMDRTNHSLLRAWGEIPPEVQILDLNTYTPKRAEWPDYVQQRRRAFFYPLDWWLDQHGHPRFVIRREGVELLRVYPFEEFVKGIAQTRHIPVPHHLAR
jgi:hypothetical protein